MTIEEWVKIAKKLKCVYQREEKFLPDGETVKEWYEFVKDLDANRTAQSANNYIMRERFAPTVADIRAEYDRISAEANKDEREIREYYERTRSYYPGSGDYNYGWEEWLTRVSEASDRVSAARWLNNRITQYVNSCEKETMDFAECIRTIK